MKHRSRPTWISKAAAIVAGLVAGGVLATSAWASYWDFSGYLPYGEAYFEYTPAGGCGGSHGCSIRLSRQYCGTKMELLTSNYIDRIPFPGGCSQSDYTYPWGYPPYDYGAACANRDGPTMWVNCKIWIS